MADKNEKTEAKKDSFAVSPGKIDLKGKPKGLTQFSRKFKIAVAGGIAFCLLLVIAATWSNWKSAPDGSGAAPAKEEKKPSPGQKPPKVTTVDYDKMYQSDVATRPPTPPVGLAPPQDPAGMGPTTPVPQGSPSNAGNSGGNGVNAGAPATVPAIAGAGQAAGGVPVKEPFGSGPAGKGQSDAGGNGGTAARSAETERQRAKTAGPQATGWNGGGGMLGDADPAAGMKASQGKLTDALNGLKQAAAGAGQQQAMLPQETGEDPNKQVRKEAFLKAASKPSDGGTLMQVVQPPLSPYLLTAGMKIPAALGCSMNTDLPGQICAHVTQNVYDKLTGNHLLIPQFTEILGSYDSHIALGQERGLVAWARLTFPDTSHLDLEGMPGADASGAAGFDMEVDNHYIRVVGTLTMASVFSAGLQMSQGQQATVNGQQTAGQQVAAAIGQNVAQTGAQITQRQLNIQPTLSRDRGYKFVVQVTRDIVFPGPYRMRSR